MKCYSNIYHIHLDIVGGIAGDMFIAGMLGAFEQLTPLVMASLSKVLPANTGTPILSTGINAGISGLRFFLQDDDADKFSSAVQDTDKHAHSHSHEHEHEHNHQSHSHDNESHAHNHNHGHKHETSYQYLCQLLRDSQLDSSILDIAIKLLTIIAKAEAKIHGKTLADVHFHELADWDSLMDVVASAVILNALANANWSTSKLPIGGGLVNTQHGLIPVPAPATTEILKGFEFIDDGIKGERITPTGAAILCYLSESLLLSDQPQGQLKTSGYGLGTKEFPGMPNILRVLSFEKANSSSNQQGTVVIIEFDIDDMTGEELALSLDLLRAENGVLDVVSQTARGKKNRAVELIRIQASSSDYQNIIKQCFMQTTTIGLRYRFETRHHLSRQLTEYNSQYCKSVIRPDGTTTTKIEHDQLHDFSTLAERRAIKNTTESL